MNLASLAADAAFALVLASIAMQIMQLFRCADAPAMVASLMLPLASLLLLLGLAIRSVEMEFVALTSAWESITFWAAMVGFVSFGYRVQKRLPYRPAVVFGATMVQLVMLAIASSPLLPKDVLPPVPALRSGWLVLHVGFALIGESFFVAGFVAALLFLGSRDASRRTELDRLTYTAIAVGYPFFTAGALVFGAIWAQQAWGRWWSWDPKETWALVTWLVYTIYLHARLVAGTKGNVPALVAVAGFLCTIFTFFGVNYLLPGLHAYG